MATIPTLKPLSESNLTIADPNEDVRDRTVVDAAGEEIGHVNDVMIDPEETKVRFLQVAAGGFFGIGEDHFLVPVDAVTRIEGDIVHIERDRERMREAPRYQPDLVARADPAYYEGLYSWWDYSPFWVGGYVPRGYPYPPRQYPPR